MKKIGEVLKEEAERSLGDTTKGGSKLMFDVAVEIAIDYTHDSCGK